MDSRPARRADRTLLLVIASCLVGGPFLTVFAVWGIARSDELDRSVLRLAVAAVIGIVVLAVAVGELRHRLLRGPQRPGRRVRDRSN